LIRRWRRRRRLYRRCARRVRNGKEPDREGQLYGNASRTSSHRKGRRPVTRRQIQGKNEQPCCGFLSPAIAPRSSASGT
jgi:hypothetical protein